MKIVISPAKSLDFDRKVTTDHSTQSAFLAESEIINRALKKKSANQLSKLMDISPSLGQLNYERNQNWRLPFTKSNARQAVFAFDGDVYKGLDVYSLNTSLLPRLENSLRIISGLYGLLKPFDLIQPYRLEMKTKFPAGKNANLYAFWKAKITQALQNELEEDKLLINLASNEYFKAIDIKTLDCTVVSPQFKVVKNGTLKTIAIFAKQARGLMARYIIENDIRTAEGLQDFQVDGYRFLASESSLTEPVFVKK